VHGAASEGSKTKEGDVGIRVIELFLGIRVDCIRNTDQSSLKVIVSRAKEDARGARARDGGGACGLRVS